MIFLGINLPSFVQFKQYYDKSGPRVLLFQARYFVLEKNIVYDKRFGSYSLSSWKLCLCLAASDLCECCTCSLVSSVFMSIDLQG